jgi:DHA2 family multidrug resistance protein
VRTQANHAAFADDINPFRMALHGAVESGAYQTATPQGLAALDNAVAREAATLAYLQDFRLMMFVALAALPMLLLLRAPRKKAPDADAVAVME